MSKARDIADLDFNSPDIDGGNIDGAVIGASTAAAGSFSQVDVDNITSSGNLTIDVAGDIILDADDEGKVNFKDGGTQYARIDNNGGTGLDVVSIISDGDIRFRGNDGGSTIVALTLDMSAAGAATFNAGATFGGDITQGNGDYLYIGGGNFDIKHTTQGQNIVFSTTPSGGSTAETLRITSDGKLSKITGDLTLDVAGDIILDADGGDVRLADGGTQFARLSDGTEFTLSAMGTDKDIKFAGNDGGVAITALTLDMSNAGYATFNSGLNSGGVIELPQKADFPATGLVHYTNSYLYSFGGVQGSIFKDRTGVNEFLKLQLSQIVLNEDGVDMDFRVESNGNANMLFVDGGSNFVSIGSANTSRQVVDNATATLRVEHGINATHTLTNSGNSRDIINIDTAGSWSQTGNSGTVSSLSWTNAPGNMMGRIGLQYGGTQTGGNSEFVIKDLYHSGFGNSGDVVRFGSNKNTRFYGSVGIGTTPSYPLHIYNPTPRIQLHDSSSGGTAYLNLDGTEVTLRNNSTNGALKLVTNNPREEFVYINGTAFYSESFTLNNGVQYDFDIDVPSEGGHGNSFFIIAGYAHNNSGTYGAHTVKFVATRSTGLATIMTIGDQTSTGGGAWQISKADNTTLRIRKTAGTYVGSGSGFITVMFRNAIG